MKKPTTVRTTQTSKGLLYSRPDVAKAVAATFEHDPATEQMRRIRRDMDGYENAAQAMDEYVAILGRATKAMVDTAETLAETSKKAGGSIRKSANELGATVQNTLRNTDIEKLERMTGTMERLATAMSTLAELEKQGRLTKLMEALK